MRLLSVQDLKDRRKIGWLLLGLGSWGVLSVLVEKLLISGDFKEISERVVFIGMYINMRVLPEFYPIFMGLNLLMATTGAVFLSRKKWFKNVGLIFLAVTFVGVSILAVRYLSVFVNDSGKSLIVVSWILNSFLLGFSAFFLVRFVENS